MSNQLESIKANAIKRLLGRALLAGVSAGIAVYLNAPSGVVAAITAAVLAAGESLTPLNALVGVGKKTDSA